MAFITNDSCVVCSKIVTARMHALLCDACARWQRRKCKTGVSAEQYCQMTKGTLDMDWYCVECSATEKTHLNSTTNEDDPPLHSIDVSPLRRLSMMRPADATYIVEPTANVSSQDAVDVTEVAVDAVPMPIFSSQDAVDVSEVATDEVSISSQDAVHVTEVAVDAVPTRSPDGTTEVPMEEDDMSFDISGRDFSTVVAPLDKSLPDRRLDPVVLEDGPTTFQLVDGGTSRGGQKLVGSDGYTYTVRRRKNSGRVYWTCSIRNPKMKCPAGVKQFRDLFTPSPVGHIHPANPGALKKVKISTKVKAVAKERVFEPAAAIVERVMKEMTDSIDVNLPKPDNLARAANHHRRQYVRRTKQDNAAVLRSLTSKLGHPAVEWLMLDFEAAIWQAIRETLPDVIIKGCVFHWTQRIWRRIQQEGLSTTYIGRGDKYEFLRMLMSLPYLPAAQIRPAFNKLKQRTEDETEEGEAIRRVVYYMERTWIDGAVWRPEHWSVFRQTVRTNNDLEGWHRRLNG